MELERVEMLKYVNYEFENILRLYEDYRNLISELAKQKMIPSPLGKFIKANLFFGLNGSPAADFYCKFGYRYGSEMDLQNDALIFPLRRVLFHSTQSVGNGSINPIYKLFRDFSDAKKYRLQYKNDLSNPFSVP
ncbi:hypothetical protein HYT25_02235 [Candidatus Pacearchaeota archaeon]|nr:hypothetical protein [Candidatus Pacearchaeota archaeon]